MAITRPAPIGFASCSARPPDAPGRRVHHHALALGELAPTVRNRCQAVRPWISSASAPSSLQAVGDPEQARGGRGRALRVAAGLEQRHHPLARLEALRGALATVPATSPPSTNGSSPLGHVRFSRWWVSPKFTPARSTSHQHLAGAWLRLGHLGHREHLGPAELVDLDGAHGGILAQAGTAGAGDDSLPPPMSLVVVGSIAFDAVKTPFGERERMLGGSAVHFSLAASFFTDVRVVGPVGDDFGDDEYAVLHGRGVNTDDIEHVRRRQDLLLAGPLRVRPEHGPHRRHPAQRVRRVRAQALGGLQGRRAPLPRQHPARPPARGARAVRRASAWRGSTR